MKRRVLKKLIDFNEDEKETLEQMEEEEAKVVKVHDGDTVTLRFSFWDFDVPFRILDINAPEMNEIGGILSRDYLKKRLLGKKVTVILGEQKIEKWGRMLGNILSDGMDIGEELILMGFATPFDDREDGKFPAEEKAFEEGRIAKEWQS